MNRERIEIWCRDLGIRGQAKKLFLLFGERGEATKQEMIDALYSECPEGGPVFVDNCVRAALWKLRDRLTGRATIEHETLYVLKIHGVDHEP